MVQSMMLPHSRPTGARHDGQIIYVEGKDSSTAKASSGREVPKWSLNHVRPNRGHESARVTQACWWDEVVCRVVEQMMRSRSGA